MLEPLQLGVSLPSLAVFDLVPRISRHARSREMQIWNEPIVTTSGSFAPKLLRRFCLPGGPVGVGGVLLLAESGHGGKDCGHVH